MSVDTNVAKALARVARASGMTLVLTTNSSSVYTLAAVEGTSDWAGIRRSVEGATEVVHGPVFLREDGALVVGRFTTEGLAALRLEA